MLKPLPIGTHTLRQIFEGGFLYIDKTRYQRYQTGKRRLLLVGVNFSTQQRAFDGWMVEKM